MEVLRQERRLLSTGDITKIALDRGFLQVQGKTPDATMASALYTDVRKKADASIFIRCVSNFAATNDAFQLGFGILECLAAWQRDAIQWYCTCIAPRLWQATVRETSKTEFRCHV